MKSKRVAVLAGEGRRTVVAVPPSLTDGTPFGSYMMLVGAATKSAPPPAAVAALLQAVRADA